MRISHLSIAMTLALLTAAAIAGCSPDLPGGETGAPTDTAGESASPSPTADEEPVVDPNILFTISVTSTAPNGAVAHLTQTVYKPVTATTQQAADEAAL